MTTTTKTKPSAKLAAKTPATPRPPTKSVKITRKVSNVAKPGKTPEKRLGRPPLPANLVRKNRSVALNDDHVEHAMSLAGGNLSQGVTLLIERSMKAQARRIAKNSI